MRGCPSVRIGVALGVITAILALLSLSIAPAALADGDPASDVLATQPLFDPWDAGSPAAEAQALTAELHRAAAVGFPIRVALINSASDLGSVGELWRRPGAYARYLGTELSHLYDGQVLVVMPTGFGLYGPPSGAHAVGPGESRVQAPSPGRGARLVTSAAAAVRLLAAAAGHPLGRVGAGPAAPDRSPETVMSPLAWIVLGLGAAVVLAAWVASLRARPFRMGRRLSA